MAKTKEVRVKAIIPSSGKVMPIRLGDGNILPVCNGSIFMLPEDEAKKYINGKVEDGGWSAIGAYLEIDPDITPKVKGVPIGEIVPASIKEHVLAKAVIPKNGFFPLKSQKETIPLMNGSQVQIPLKVALKYRKGNVEDAEWKSIGAYLEFDYEEPKKEKPNRNGKTDKK